MKREGQKKPYSINTLQALGKEAAFPVKAKEKGKVSPKNILISLGGEQDRVVKTGKL